MTEKTLHDSMKMGDADDTGAFQPPSMKRRTSRDRRNGEEDVVAMMKRDMSYKAVASAVAQMGDRSSDEDSLLSLISEDDPNNEASSTSLFGDLSTSFGSSKNKDPQSEEEALEQGIAWRRKWVLLLLGVVACLVGVAIAAVSVGIQKGKNDQEELTSGKSEEQIASLSDASQEQQRNLQTSLQSFVHSLTASFPHEDQWPFVTHPLFEIQGQPARVLSPAIETLALAPFVKPLYEAWWQTYSWDHQNWIRDNWRYLGNDTVPMETIAPTIYPTSGAVDNPYEYKAPLWQTSPPPTEAVQVNHDMLTVPPILELYQQLNDTSQGAAVVSPLLQDLPHLYGQPQTDNVPRSLLLLPVHSTLDKENANGKTVALMQVVLNWEQFLQELIPSHMIGQKATLQTPNCGDDDAQFQYSPVHNRLLYQPDNNETNVVHEDKDDDDDDDHIVIYLDHVLGPDVEGCSYSLALELQPLLQSDNDTDEQDITGILVLALIPLAIGLVVVGLIWALLLQYNQMTTDRYDKLHKSSAKANAIVNSMFPSTIRGRLMAEEGEQDRTSSKKGRNNNPNKWGESSDHDLLASGEFTINNHDMIGKIEEESEHLECCPNEQPTRGITASGSERLKKYLDTGLGGDDAAPIADLFPNCTVLLADISGFTAWSSVREPSQVFTLLETLYKKFDEIAKKRHVFKVETVGDCYVAVTGLPEIQEDHALIMVRFARDCMYKSYELTKKLEVTLGPDTAELSMRFGLHSGPVTAGVLRGDRARFQLFGDTVNTASRMESTGQKGRIQMSEETADILVLMGKSHLIRQREDTVTAKGKGEMTTYWLALGADPDDVEEDGIIPRPTSLTRNVSGVESIMEGNEDETENSGYDDHPLDNTVHTVLSVDSVPVRRKPPAVSMSGLHSFKALRDKRQQSKKSRLVDWNVEILGRLLKHVIARRNALGLEAPAEEVRLERPEGQTVLEEVREIITLPKFDASAAKQHEDPEKMELDSAVKKQLHDYVSTLASMYWENPFHNYEHASHVTMSVVKLLSRIIAPKRTEGMTSEEKLASELHDHTYGITSDPLTQFAVVLSALIHDVDHTGVPNTQLVKEDTKVAAHYKGKSVAEQNSLDLSWDLLMEQQYKELRNTIYCDEAELTRFRSLVVNTVMATDIVDKELKQLRNNRWDKAFSGDDPVSEEEVHAAVNRKATIVLEHLIQASDVSHTMQHWHVYRKWNERLFDEMYSAYRAGRAEKDPAEFWYKGEIGFFDFYIIPLAKKLKDCGVFGVSSDEYLNYAMKNRDEWARKGEAVTAEMVAKARDKDLARVEKRASLRAPVIAEMKAAVLSMRSPHSSAQQFRQPSFRHLQTEPDATETITMPLHGFSRMPPRRVTPNTRNVNDAMSIGSAERDALKKFRQSHPCTGLSDMSRSGRSDMSGQSDMSASSIAPRHPPGNLLSDMSRSGRSDMSGQSEMSASSIAPRHLPGMPGLTDMSGSGQSDMDTSASSIGRSDMSALTNITAPSAASSMGLRKPQRRGSCHALRYPK